MKDKMIFQTKNKMITPICICGKTLYSDYKTEDTIECPKCSRIFNINDFRENATILIDSLLTLFPKDILLEEPSLKEGDEDYGKKADLFSLFNYMTFSIREWKKKADYYDKIHKLASDFTQESYWNGCFLTNELEKFLIDLVFSISYENNIQNEKIQIY